MNKILSREERLEAAREGLMKEEFDLAGLTNGTHHQQTVMKFTQIYKRLIRAWQDVIAELGGVIEEEKGDDNKGEKHLVHK